MRLKIPLAFGAILLLALLIRVKDIPSHMLFMVDESRITTEIYQAIRIHKIPLIGDVQSNLKIPMGPLYYYLGMPFLILSHNDPRSLGYLNAFIGLFGIIIVYCFTRTTISFKTSVISTITLALSTAFTAYSNKPFPPVLLLITVPLFYWTIRQAIYYKSHRWLWYSFFFAGLSLHIHSSGIVLLPIAIFLWWLFVRKISIQASFLALFSFSLPLFPLIVTSLKSPERHFLILHNTARVSLYTC